jgi:hypothetical protein
MAPRNRPPRRPCRQRAAWAALAASLALLGALALALVPAAPPAAAARRSLDPLGLSVRGNQLVDAAGHPVRLLGVDRSGSEYRCLEAGALTGGDSGIFDGPVDAASIQAMQSWQINAVRLSLNEDCWLGINGVNPTRTGPAYQSAILDYVTRLNNAGLYVVLDLHWSAPDAVVAHAQQPMPDDSHARDFWHSVAVAFQGDPAVAFDLYNEPFLAAQYVQTPGQDPWACWLNGCMLTHYRTGGTPDVAYHVWKAVGMQVLVDTIRVTGARNVILVSGLNYADDLSGWLTHEPRDPAGQLVAAWHTYPGEACATTSCWDTTVAPVAAQVPVAITEYGDHNCAAPALVPALLPWADRRGLSYLAWTWNAWGGCENVLIQDTSGAPAADYGRYVHDHVAAVVGADGYATSAGPPNPAHTPTAAGTPTTAGPRTPEGTGVPLPDGTLGTFLPAGAIVLAGVLLALLILGLSAAHERQARARLDAEGPEGERLLERLRERDDFGSLAAVESLLRAGRQDDAVMLLREETGASRVGAGQAVDLLDRELRGVAPRRG